MTERANVTYIRTAEGYTYQVVAHQLNTALECEQWQLKQLHIRNDS